LTAIRFRSSPLWETVLSLRALQTAVDHRFHRRWRDSVVGDLKAGSVDMELLVAIVRPRGYIPDFLVPAPDRLRVTIGDELAAMAASDSVIVAAQLEHLAVHHHAQAGVGRDSRVRLVRSLANDPAAAVRTVVDQLTIYWTVAVEPYWDRIERLAEAEVAFRLEQLAGDGTGSLLSSLHPRVSFDQANEIHVEKYYDTTASADRRGLLLIPSVFAWPDVIVRTAHPHPPILTYSPRGHARLWRDVDPVDHSQALGDLLGKTRAALLLHLDLPMTTTQLARHLAISPPTANSHLKVLQSAGIVASRRHGRSVFYKRTPKGDALTGTRSA
jgi:DNA-binding transcriptional ArsR family regulator